MKNDRLQMRIDSDVKSDVQEYAKEKGTTLSALVTTFLKGVSDQVRQDRQRVEEIKVHEF